MGFVNFAVFFTRFDLPASLEPNGAVIGGPQAGR